ncbi:hypothetical protein [Actinomadura harenae]|uniref:LPXTG cell wall anchor domain-containing protein n=1 Tax=Actinomadura harenae TaxID=2483351 RepID=A0A3M2M014_9ACTN|nr:hypothetical protein [Actinomadura harenae]RMI41705.1 hypothetical protein EBO15_22315 [Actinomadura harenae]
MGSSSVRRIAAVGTASGAVLAGSLAAGAVPAFALAGKPSGASGTGAPSVSIEPRRFTPGQDVTVRISGCKDEPSAGGQNEVFVQGDPSHFKRTGATTWSGVGTTLRGLKPGNAYMAKFQCTTASGPRTLTLFATLPEKRTPLPPPSGGGHGGGGGGGGGGGDGKRFHFGFDDVDLSTRTVLPGGRLGMKVHCPTEASATSSSFVRDPRFEETGKDTWEATATFERSLPSVVRVTIACAGYGHVVFTTRPGRDEVSPGPAIPQGAPETGDGSTVTADPGARAPYLGAGAAFVALAGTGLALRRRTSKARL